MPWAILVRAANVGNNTLRPRELVGRLPALQLTSLGAAGTFAARGGATAASVRRAVADALPFGAEVLVEPADRWHAYVAAHANEPDPPSGCRRYLALTSRPVGRHERLPLHFPDPAGWGVTITSIEGTFVSGLYRRLEPRMLYPNAVVEKRFGVPATTRWWETVVALDGALTGGAEPRPGTGRRGATTSSPGARGRAGRRAA